MPLAVQPVVSQETSRADTFADIAAALSTLVTTTDAVYAKINERVSMPSP